VAVSILPKRSHSAATVPTTSDLVAGELAVNTADTKIYMRDDSNNIVRVSGQTAAEVTAKAMALAIALG
jgi:hypothetical protein